MAQKKSYTAEQKVLILRELLENKVPISQIVEKYHVHVNDIYNWKKKLFEGASLVFENGKSNHQKPDQAQAKIVALEEKLKKRDEAISFLVQDNMTLKKVSMGRIKRALGRT